MYLRRYYGKVLYYIMHWFLGATLNHIRVIWMEPQRIKSIQKHVTDIRDESPN